MKKKANLLNPILTREIKTRPHFFTGALWDDIKQILEEFRCCLVDDFLTMKQLAEIYVFMDIGLEGLAHTFNSESVYSAHNYVYEVMEHYLKLSIEYELYESAQNIRHLLDKFYVKVPKVNI